MMLRSLGASAVVRRSAVGAIRGYYGEINHTYQNDNVITQTNGVDPIHRVKGEQQDWLNTQQWAGYSDTYLEPHMRYTPAYEAPNGQMNFHHRHMEHFLGVIYEMYGPAADVLEDLEADILSPAYHQKIVRAKEHAKKFEDEIDKIYAKLHPTLKTIVDAFMVRRHYALADWITLVERKRKQTLERLSPEFIEKQRKYKGVAENHMRNLERISAIFEENPTFHLEGTGLDEGELEVVRQRIMYHRRHRKFGQSLTAADYQPL
jgi:hypothetical protein